MVFNFLTSISVLILLLWNAGSAVEDSVKDQGNGSTKDNLLNVLEAESYAFTPSLRKAFLDHAREEALLRLKEKDLKIPQEFIDWIDSDLDIASGVYAAHHKSEDVLLWLYSLRFDLGKNKFEQYRHLALAAALVSAKEGMEADISPRDPLKIIIPDDPRKLIDTKGPGRKMDVNDHIINFLNDHTIEEKVLLDPNKRSKLKYDDRGIAIPSSDDKKKEGELTTETRTRSLYASDVLASQELQSKFNSYMESKGLDISIDCGEKIIHWDSKAMVRGESYRKINEAYALFRQAYEAKGLLPSKRDDFASPAERCVYMIRNYEYKFPPNVQEQRKWPRFPLTAPWPLLTMLAADRQPLREREERWIAFRDHGEFYKYGEYIGGIAQQHAMQSARRLKPYPFTYATIQMMLKDGGVCGTMGSISARGHNILGVPSCQAVQPGHCAVVYFQYDSKGNSYSCKGGQYATGGDEKTGPFTPWPFDASFKRTGRKNGYEIAFHNRKPMVYHQSLAWGVNYGVRSYLDATIAHAVFNMIPPQLQKDKGFRLLKSTISMNPYHFLIVNAAQDAASSVQGQIQFWNQFVSTLSSAAKKPGCPTEGLYKKSVKSRMFARIASFPVPKEKQSARKILSFLEGLKCDNKQIMDAYRSALN
ncbi:MAG: hypothetical protein GWP42_05340 [Verrucomicrobiales bacterium]|nr:hypothetical protein [Verrucomicrobiales bacterium]